MFLLIRKRQEQSTLLPNLNTSHVLINRFHSREVFLIMSNLNTSHVLINRKGRAETSFISEI